MINNYKITNETLYQNNIDNILKNNILRYAGINNCETNNGKKFGVTFFTQYCTHHCKGCHNKSTWSKNGGLIFTKDIYNKLFKYLKEDYINRLTLSGGDPIDSLILSNCISVNFKYNFPNKELWIYTGYTYEYLKNKKEYDLILNLCDYLIDGLFVEELKDLRLPFRGSSNQRIWQKKDNIWREVD